MLFFPKDPCPWFNSSEGSHSFGDHDSWECSSLPLGWQGCGTRLGSASLSQGILKVLWATLGNWIQRRKSCSCWNGEKGIQPSSFPGFQGFSWGDVPDHKQKELQTPWEEGTASAMRGFFHCLENSNRNNIFPAVSLQQGEPFMLQAEGFLWNSTSAIRSTWQHDVTITFSGHSSWVNKWPNEWLANSRTVKVRRKWVCSRSHCKFQSSTETEPRSLIHIHILNQYFKKIKV